MALFNLPARCSRASDAAIAQKANKPYQEAQVVIKGGGKNGGTLAQRIGTIKALVEKHLGKLGSDYIAIRDEETLVKYIDTCIADGVVAIDTETTSLNTMLCTMAGISLYSPSNKAAYIPVNHTSYITGAKTKNQIPVEFVSEQIARLAECKKKIMFNANFDMRVLKHQLGWEDYKIVCTFDGSLAAWILNENEPSHGLKALHAKYCLGGKADAFSFEDFFKGIPFTYIPIDTGYLYAAHDAKITYELYMFQDKFLNPISEGCRNNGLEGISNLFYNIEMPLIPIVIDMEDTGVALDFEYQRSLQIKYEKLLKEKEAHFFKVLDLYSVEVEAFKSKNPGHKLGNPINLGSTDQMAIVLYDILGLDNKNKKQPRSTKEDFISHIDHDIVRALLAWREVQKLMTTYITKMPDIVHPATQRIHCSFKQIGAVTGRFSSSEPNMQNIPSHNKDIRPMFKASTGCLMLSSDYSKQEPAITSRMAQDDAMIQAFIDGKDIYSVIASMAYSVSYEECCENHPDGSENPLGAERRGAAKAIVLGICYGKQVKSIAEDLKVSIQVAQQIYDKVMTAFPKLKQFMEDSQNMARELGYVDTFWGRKRRLPDMQLQEYEFSYIEGVSSSFDALDFDAPVASVEEVDWDTQSKYIKLLNKAYGYRQRQAIYETAERENIKIKDNSYVIQEATRQCVNSRIQGSAADMTKLAMLSVGNNERLKEIGFKLLLQVHDELIAEVPKEHAKEAAELFSKCMVDAAKELEVPIKCDVAAFERWYGKKISLAA